MQPIMSEVLSVTETRYVDCIIVCAIIQYYHPIETWKHKLITEKVFTIKSL